MTSTEDRATFAAGAQPGDAELLRRFIDDRDAAAMTAIIKRHGPLVMGLCRSLLRNEQDAADAFQTTFLVLLKNAKSIGKPGSLSSWLHGVANRVALRARSQAARQRQRESSGAAMAPGVPPQSDKLADAETVRLIHEELGHLPEQLRLPIILCCLQGESREEAARQLGWSLGSLKGRLERARETLQKRLTRRGVVLSATALSGLLMEQGTLQVPAALAASTLKSLVLVAAGKSIIGGVVSANAAALTTGVLISMKIAKLKIAALIAVAALLSVTTTVVVVATVKGMIEAQKPVAIPLPAQALNLAPAQGMGAGTYIVVSETESAVTTPQARARQNLKMLGLAMHNYLDQHQTFPPQALRAPDGTPLLSWRVALLPYVGEAALYAEFKLDEPWDSPHNLPLSDRMPSVFNSTGTQVKSPSETVFQVYTGEGTMFPKSGAIGLRDNTDGTSNTLLVVEASKAVTWTKPEDLPYAPHLPLPELGGSIPEGFVSVLADGSSKTLSHKTTESAMRALISAAGGDVVITAEAPLVPPAPPATPVQISVQAPTAGQ